MILLSTQELTALVDAAVRTVDPLTDPAWRPKTPAPLTAGEIAAMIDHTALKPETTGAQIDQLCVEAVEYGFASVCVNPTWIERCVERLAGSDVQVCTVVGFPLGAMLPAAKAVEAEQAVAAGATEVDMVINIGRLKDGDYGYVYEDIAGVVLATHGGAVVKVILEMCLLTTEEKVAASVLAKATGANFVKTSTGFNGGGATLPDVALMRAAVGPEMGLKAAGGVKTAEDVRLMAAAGATRIGASAGVNIMRSISESAAEPEATSKGGY